MRADQTSLTREQERVSLMYRAILASLLADPDAVMTKARDNIGRRLGVHRNDGMSVAYLRRWETTLDRGLDAVVDAVLDPSPGACEMRQNSPFAGVLPDDVRRQVLRSFSQRYGQA